MKPTIIDLFPISHNKYVLMSFVLWCLIFGKAYSQSNALEIGTIKEAQSGAKLFNQDPFMSHNNAGLSMDKDAKMYIGLYGTSLYEIQDFTQVGIGFQKRLSKSNSFGVGVHSIQNSNRYISNMIFAGFNQQLSDNIFFGVGINYRRQTYQYRNEITHNEIFGQAGITYQFHPAWKWAVQLGNINAYRVENGYTPRSYRLSFSTGLNYSLNDKINLLTELEISGNNDLTSKIAMNYQPTDKISLYCGFSILDFGVYYTYNYSLGFGYSYRKIQILIALGTHSYLGLTPNAGFYYQDVNAKNPTLTNEK